ncbi:MAG: hypothetical protein IPL48_15735 [Bacteroidetes bacterium]|nr:hypothetical protein [Bacteroidota bacterium]
MQKETLKAFLQDEVLREKLKTTYNIEDKDIDNITMTSSENIIEIIIIKEMINKNSSKLTSNIAAAQINNFLDSRMKQKP